MQLANSIHQSTRQILVSCYAAEAASSSHLWCTLKQPHPHTWGENKTHSHISVKETKLITIDTALKSCIWGMGGV